MSTHVSRAVTYSVHDTVTDANTMYSHSNHHTVCDIIINTNNVYSQYHYSVRDRVCTHTITINTNNVYSQYHYGVRDRVCTHTITINTNNVYSQYHYGVRDRVCTHTITINTNNVYSQYHYSVRDRACTHSSTTLYVTQVQTPTVCTHITPQCVTQSQKPAMSSQALLYSVQRNAWVPFHE